MAPLGNRESSRAKGFANRLCGTELQHLSTTEIEEIIRSLSAYRLERQKESATPDPDGSELRISGEHPGQEGLYENLFTANHAVMLLIDPVSSEIVDANPAACRFYGYQRHSLVGRPVSDINLAQPGAINRMLRDVAEGRRHRLEVRHRLASGEVRDVEIYSGPLDQGAKILLFSIIHDISDRKRTEQDLKRARIQAEDASRAKSEFLAHMSHEIRTPMTVVLAALEQLRSSGIQPHQRRLLEMAETSATTLLKLINDILDISRIEARKVEIRREPFLLRELLKNTVEMFQPKATEKNLRLCLEVAENLPCLVIGDPDRLRQVLINLLGNALKFTERGGVRMTAIGEKGGICLGVIDTGIGMPADATGHLFEAFCQFERERTRRHDGSGLGLAISKALVELMGGKILVESEEGQGSTFRIILPLSEAGDEPGGTSTSSSSPDGEAIPPTPARILLAEDDAMLRHLISEQLRQRTWEVETAENGLEALEIWQSQPIDLVLMDLQMPKMDGLEATREIRQREGGSRHTPIVALTAFAREEDREICLQSGMDGYAPKPIDSATLYRTIEELLRRR